MTEVRTCRKCLQEKELDKFHKRPDRENVWLSRCDECAAEYRSLYYRLNREKSREDTENWRLSNAEKSKEIWLRSDHGLALEDWKLLKALQGGLCAVCGHSASDVEARSKTQKWKNLCIDHCHETGLVRGLICDRCNRGLGMFWDRIDLLTKAISYLQNPPATGLGLISKNTKPKRIREAATRRAARKSLPKGAS